MKNRRITGLYFVFAWFGFVVLGNAQERIRFDFSGATAGENDVTIMGAGFGMYPLADVFFKDIATDNAFEDATDGHGVLIEADGGETVMIIGPQLDMPYAAMIRCSVRTDKPYVAITLATVDQGPNVFISTNSPNNGEFFLNQYKRLCTFCVPPSTGFQPLIQVVNTSDTEQVLISLDNLDIYPIDPTQYYHGDFLNGDEIDPSRISVSENEIHVESTPTPTIAPTATPVATPTLTPNPGQITIDLDLPSSAKPLEMILIPAGAFTMGSPSDENDRDSDEGPQHEVTISQPFYLGKYEMTQAQYEAVIGSNPSSNVGINNPVDHVGWYDCAHFCNLLSEMHGREKVYNEETWEVNYDANGYRLPTEAEWEYACRAGTVTRYYWGEDLEESEIDDYAWHSNNTNETQEVGMKLPNVCPQMPVGF